ncbi:imm11 family protein [Pyxidicoccus sp. 3LG]
MTQRFFRLKEDVQTPGRWQLDDPTDSRGREVDDPRDFNMGRPVHVEGSLKVAVQHAGQPLDFTLTALSVPIIHVKVAEIFTELAPNDVQLIPVDIPGYPDQFLILVATKLIRCIDEKASKVQFWMPEDGLPEKVGQYYAVDDLRIDPTKPGDTRTFRTEGWTGALIVSEDIKQALERVKATGVKFTQV